MNKKLGYAIAIVAFAGFIGCTSNALTHKSQLSLVSDDEVLSTASSQYKQFLSTNKVISTSSGSKDAAAVTRVSNRIIAAVKKYYTDIGQPEQLNNYAWEVNTVVSNEANAWCMPGGKIVVYTGLLPITQNDAALAVVVGHEVTHALANHGKQRMNQQLLEQLGGQALSVALANKPQQTQQVFASAYGLGMQYGVTLPFGRQDEYEADKYGLIFTALAGYDPHEAINFWNRMQNANSGKAQPEFLSTHPSDANRIAQLQSMMDETVAKYYKPQR
ncbi:M48 family metallopeptidase [Parasediminibacterium sp. JCM 36343]|uniref:M48 family metallopeptidase n=1 Tax=Parasediminibacterium sp. JCM 36343 TaxID=3374279 RepID=UPI00397E5887